MEKAQMIQEVVQMVTENLELLEPVTPTSDLKELGLDSVHTIALIMTLEERYEIEFEDDDLHLRFFATVENIVGLVSRKLAEK